MKVTYLEIAGFRGVREKIRLELPPGFAVISGRNGVGKSTVLDAIDFALTGSMNKFAVTEAKGGGIEEHIWWVGEEAADAHYVTVGFADAQGEAFSVTRTREKGLVGAPTEILARLCRPGWVGRASMGTLMQTTLIRDELIAALSLDLPEQARFKAVRAAMGAMAGSDHSSRTQGLLKAAETAKGKQQRQLDEAHAELGRLLTTLTEARSAAQRSADVSEALSIIKSVAESVPTHPAEREKVLRELIANKRLVFRELEEARLLAEGALAETSRLMSGEFTAELANAQDAAVLASRDNDVAQLDLETALHRDAAERSNDTRVAEMASLLRHGSAIGLQDGSCPLCGASRTPQEFEAAIKTEAEQLKERGKALEATAAAVERARSVAARAANAVEAAGKMVASLEGRRAALDAQLEDVSAIYVRLNFEAPAEDPSRTRELLLREQERVASLERALFILESSTAADRVASLEGRVEALRNQIEQLTAQFADAESAVETARQIDASAKAVAHEVLTEQFDTVMPLLKELYRRLRPHPEWREIESDFGGRIRGSLNFVVGDGRNPQFLFSSGQRRAAGLSFLLAVHLSRPWCAWESVLLDDPVQHIDDYRAINLAEVLTAIRRTGKQVIVAVEDPALADLLCRRLRSANDQIGRRFDLRTSHIGGTIVGESRDFYPMLPNVLDTRQAS